MIQMFMWCFMNIFVQHRCSVVLSIVYYKKFANNIRKTVVEDKQNTNLKRPFLSSILNSSSIRTLVDVNGHIYQSKSIIDVFKFLSGSLFTSSGRQLQESSFSKRLSRVPAHCVIAVFFGLIAQRKVLFNFFMRDGIKQMFLLIFWDPNLNAGLICGQVSYSRIPLIRALNGKERLVIRHCYGK